MIKNPFLGPKYFTNRFSCTNTKLNQVTIQFYAKIVARLLLKLGWDILPHICRIAAANPKWLPLCRGNWKVRQNDQYTHEYSTFDFLKIAEYKYYITQLPTHIDLLGYGNFSRRQFRQMAAKNMKFVGAFSLPLFSTPSKLRIKHLFGWSLHNIGENPKGMCVASSFFDIEPTFL